VDLAVGGRGRGGGERWGTTSSLVGGVRREGSVEGPLTREESVGGILCGRAVALPFRLQGRWLEGGDDRTAGSSVLSSTRNLLVVPFKKKKNWLLA